MKFGCLETGSNSERVAKKIVNPRDEIVSFRTMSDVLNSLLNGQTDYAVVPVENSITGEIPYKSEIKRLGLVKIGEGLIDIRHCLALKNKFIDIGFILSHPEALKQCRDYLRKFNSTAYIGKTGSTAEAARIIAGIESTNGAAIADYQTCEDYGLVVRDANIVRNNKSLFWIVKK